MDSRGRREEHSRPNRIRAFRAELVQLEHDRVLTLSDDQRTRLERYHERVLEESSGPRETAVRVARTRSWGARLAAMLGAAAFFAAYVLFWARMWGWIGPIGQGVVLAITPLALLAAAEILRKRAADPFYAQLVAVAAAAAFIGGLNVLGGVLNLDATPFALLAWSVFCLLLAWSFQLRLGLIAGLLTGISFVSGLLVELDGSHWSVFLLRPETLLAGALVSYSIPLFGRGSRADRATFRMVGAAVAFLSFWILSIEGSLSWLPLSARSAEQLYQVIGLVASAAVIAHAFALRGPRFVWLGTSGFLAFLFVKLTALWWHWMPKYLFFLVIGTLAIAAFVVIWRLRTRMLGRAVA